MPTVVDRSREVDPSRAAGLPPTEFNIAGISLHISSDDPLFVQEFGNLFGERPAATPPVATLHVTVSAHATPDMGQLRVEGDSLPDPAAFLLQFASPTVPFVALDGGIGLEGSSEPLFVFRGEECLFARHPRWRRIVSHFIFLRALRMRSDLLFFHAASVRVRDAGALLIGPKGSGKTTLSLSIAAEGHTLLGDETAAYQAAGGVLLPMLRPASIKPGVRSSKVDALMRNAALHPDEDGLLHVRPDLLFGATDNAPVPLRAVFFLTGFGETPAIEPVTAGRDELASMQPLRCSSMNDAPSRNVFAMIRLLNGVRCFRVRAGDLPATTNLMIEVLETL